VDFNPGPTALNANYLITPADILTGFVIFTLTSTNNSPCPLVADTVKMGILTIASVNSGNNQSVCSSQNNISLNGTVLGAAGTGSWSVNGTGPFFSKQREFTYIVFNHSRRYYKRIRNVYPHFPPIMPYARQ